MKKRKSKIKVSKKSMLKEHVKLVRVLEKGSKEEQKKEAKSQRKEMKEYR